MNEEKCLLEIKTKYTEEEYLKFNKFHMFIKDKRIIMYIVLNIIVLLGVIFYIFNKMYLQSFIFCTIIAILDILIICRPKMFVKKIIKSDKVFGKLENTIKFYDTYLECSNDRANSKVNYSDLYMCYFYQNNFYLYMNRTAALLILGKDITEENIKVLKELLKDKVKEKFIIK